MGFRTYRMVPGDTIVNPITIPGTNRTYKCAQGAAIDVPDFDYQVLDSVGWVPTHGTGSAGGDVGPTSGRPDRTTVSTGFQFMDTTLNAVVVFAGYKTGWVHAVTGAIV